MILVQNNRKDFEYDIYSLLKAFYPQQEIKFSKEEETKQEDQEILFQLIILIKDSRIAVALSTNSHKAEDSVSVNLNDRKESKNQLKKILYQMLSSHTNKSLPWGTLTGIRPTKIPMQCFAEGMLENEIHEYMKETYLMNDQKIQLSIDIAKREKTILDKIDCANGYSLYIGIPFCPSTCLYCSFTSYPISSYAKRVDEYLKALEKDLLFTAEKFAHKKLNTIYIGGGTPTTLTASQMDWLLNFLKEHFDYSDLLEFTVEAGRPDSVTKEKLEVLKKHDVSRISINPQTMNQDTLKIIGRHHTVEQTKEAFYLARELGFDNINMDLILGLPEEMLEDVQHTMEEIKTLAPDSITVHSLAIKRAARLRMCKEQYESLRIVNTNETIDLAARYAEQLELYPYYLYRQKNMAGNLENVGFAKQDKACIYNILIMEEKQTILAAGAGATSKIVLSDSRIERIENVKDVSNYIERIDEMIERKRKFFESNSI